jgi:hypothetical protein
MSVNDASIIVIDDCTVMPQIVALLTDDSRGVINNRNFVYSKGQRCLLGDDFLTICFIFAKSQMRLF